MLSVVNLSIVVPVCWVSGNSHAFSAHAWSVRSIDRLVDLLETKMFELSNDTSLIMKEEFMMNIFSALQDEIESYDEHIKCLCYAKAQHKVVHNGTKLLQFKLLRDELFNPTDTSNIESDFLADDLGIVLAETILKEPRDK